MAAGRALDSTLHTLPMQLVCVCTSSACVLVIELRHSDMFEMIESSNRQPASELLEEVLVGKALGEDCTLYIVSFSCLSVLVVASLLVS